ncbi:hypothetical protein JJC00_00650 [Bradyrhizobium diazoefficiens]|uniref:hypothetical protein n=1 Tax=Bradyrhizobium diazoefficiens TaxID=1355477 RepID=UPI00190D05B4|nr:hypothetical protein [Bradyrhizobium diazoefficiens]QQO34264.1 hypothetical protein JJC00_00650 [Bradyrhizobium diazoefficiens]
MKNSSELIVPVIEQYLEQQGNLTFINNFDEAMRGREQRLPARELDSPTAQLAWRLYDLCKRHFFMMRVQSLKLAEISRGILWASQAGNPTIHISLTRALFEHLSAFSFQVDELSKISNNLSRQSDLGKLIGTMHKHHSTLERMYYGQDIHGGSGHPKPFHVNDFRKVLENDYPDQNVVYATLCDYVHPNYGSNSLVSSGKLGEGVLSQPPSAFQAQIELANACAIKCLTLANGYELEGSRQLIKLDNFVEIASRDGERPSTVFSKKGLSHLGDGKCQETAIQFTKVRTHGEAVEMIYRYIEQEKLRFIGRQTKTVEDGFLFEVCQTNEGPLWFKTKLEWP